jgi:NAD(P)H-dependent FMN reductase
MARLLIVHHTASPALHTLFDAVHSGASDDQIEGVEVVARAALVASAIDVLHADGYVLGTPANLGYLSGALKHFFDTIYYPCIEQTAGRPFGLYVHGNDDVEGAVRAAERITTGLGWRQAHDHVRVIGPPSAEDRTACWDLGATLAAVVGD